MVSLKLGRHFEMSLFAEASAGYQESIQQHYVAAASVTAAAILVALAWRLYTPLRSYIVLSRLPHPRASNLLGNMEMLSPYQHRIFLQYAKKYGGVYTLRILWQKVSYRTWSSSHLLFCNVAR